MKKDIIANLERKADNSLNGIDSFISVLESAKSNALGIEAEADLQTKRLSDIKSKCKRVNSFTDAILKIANNK